MENDLYKRAVVYAFGRWLTVVEPKDFYSVVAISAAHKGDAWN